MVIPYGQLRPVTTSLQITTCGLSVGRVKCCWSSPGQLILISGPFRNHDRIFILSRFSTDFEIGPPLQREERFEGLTTNGHSLH
jgi:hypothetical protein